MNTPEKNENAQSATAKRRGVLSYAPSVIVLAAIAAVGFWGHTSGWTAPKFSQLTGSSKGHAEEDWCAEHNVPESTCIKCHPELVGATAKDWCPEHGLPESKCTICHPEILTTGVAGDWCPEHAMPESSCTLCHPEIAVKGQLPAGNATATVSMVSAATAKDASATAAGRGAEKSHTGAKNPRTCQTHAMRVQFASADSIRKAGVRMAQVSQRAMAESVSANGEAEYDRRHLAAISSPVNGRVWRVLKGLGQEVTSGEVIALVESVEVGSAKSDLLETMAGEEQARKTLERTKASAEKGFRTQAELQETEGAANAARIRLFAAQQRLANLGLSVEAEAIREARSEAAIRMLGIPQSLRTELGDSAPASLLPLVSPLDGVVIAQESVAGEAVDERKALVTVANVGRMWIRMDLPASIANSVVMGQEASFAPDGDPTRTVRGKISWIDTALDEQTRTLRARAEVENPERSLKAGSFGRVRITTRKSGEATVVPADALQWEGCCHIVFVRLADTIFQTRKVKLGARTEEFVEVTNGVLPGEVIASAGSNVLRAEILKSNLGAGCADH